jgi:Fur family peroxide stress response transcriptional regulator
LFSVADIQQKLKEGGLKATHQRITILRALVNSGIHPTIDWLYESINQDHPAISLATVYKTMETLVESGIVRKVKSEDGKTRFDGNLENHNHIYCEQTGRIFDFQDAELQKLIQNYLANKQFTNFNVEDIQLQISGSVVDPNKPVHYKN